MADAKASFAIVLEDMLSPGAAKAKASVAALSGTLEKAKTDLAGYQAQLSLAKDLGDVSGYRKYSALVGQSKQSVFGLVQQLEGAKTGLGGAAVSAETLSAALGPIAMVTAAAASGLAALTAVTAGFVVKALEVVNAKQKMVATFEALGDGAGEGKKVAGMLGELSSKLPQTTGELATWTKHLQAMGITDLSKIRSELIATASAQAIMGDEGAAAYQKIQERVRMAVEAHHGLKLAEKSLKSLYAAGVNQTEVAKRMGMTTQELGAKLKVGTIDAQKFGDAISEAVTAKGKGPLDVMMNSLEVMGKKANAAFSRLFADVDTKPLTDALRNVIALGDAGAPSGEALKAGITGGLNAVIRMLGRGITEAEIFFLTIEVQALQAYIALKPIINAVGKIADGMSAVGGVLGGAKKTAVDSVAGGLGIDPGIVEKQGTNAGTMLAAGLGGPLLTSVEMFRQILTTMGDAEAQGIAHAAGVASGKAMIDGIKEGTQTHSPSLAAIKIGMGIGEGLGMGIEASPAPERAARTISSNALGGLAGGKNPFGGGGANDNAGGASIGAIHIAITAPEGVTDAQQLSVIGLSTALERYQIGSGR